jgi:hypothetical protein
MPAIKPLLNMATGGLSGAFQGGGAKSILSGGVLGSGGKQGGAQGQPGPSTFPGGPPGAPPGGLGGMLAGQFPAQGRPQPAQGQNPWGQAITQPAPQAAPQPSTAQPGADQAWLDRQARRASGGGFQGGAQAPLKGGGLRQPPAAGGIQQY